MSVYTFTTSEVPLARPGVQTGTFRVLEDGSFEPLSQVRWLEVSVREGPHPSKASFEYVSGNYLPDMMPIGFEDTLPIAIVENPDLVKTDDELVVVYMDPEGNYRFLFHGFAQVPETNFSDNQLSVTFQAQGVEARCWDEPLAYAVMRDAGDLTNPSKNIWTGNPIRFNPRLRGITVPNQVADGWEAARDTDGRPFAAFLDEQSHDRTVTVGGVDKPAAQFWNLFTSVNAILTQGNWDEKYVKNLGYDTLKSLLNVLVPTTDVFFDPNDSTTYTTKPINIPDTDITGKPFPDAVDLLLKPNGYEMCFRLTDDGVMPVTYLDIYKVNDNTRAIYKDFYLQDWNEDIDPALNNVGRARMAMDISNIVNEVAVDTSPIRTECGLILAPMFKIVAGDAAYENRKRYDPKSPDFKLYRDKFRLFGVDETGEGHLKLTYGGPDSDGRYSMASSEWVTDIMDLSPIFGKDKDGNPLFVQRRRPPFNDLWTKDVLNEYLRAELYVSINYLGPAPAIWDGTSGDWYRVGGGLLGGNFVLCRDRLGIRSIAQDINAWHMGKMPRGTPYPLGHGELRILKWLASDDPTDHQWFTFMLVCVIEGDQHLDVKAARRPVSPTKFTVQRIVNRRDRLRPGVIHPSSYHHPDRGSSTAAPIDVGVVKQEATDYAVAKRESRQIGKWAGPVIEPRLTMAYRIGDRIRQIVGRNAPMQLNLDGNGREAPIHPRIVGITWVNSPHQATHFILSDERSDHAQ